MKITVEVTANDFIDFQINDMKTSKIAREHFRNARLILAFVYSCTIVTFYFLFEGITFYMSAGLIVLFAVIQIVSYKDRTIKRTIKKIQTVVAGDNAKNTLGKKEYEITENNYLVCREDSGETSFDIRLIEKIQESNYNYFLYRDKISAYIIPKKSETESAKAVAEFIQRIKEIKHTDSPKS